MMLLSVAAYAQRRTVTGTVTEGSGYPAIGITVVEQGTQNGAVFRAAHADPGATLYWHIDDEFVGQTVGEHELHVDPAPGGHVLTLIDSQGARRAQRFTVK